MTNGELQKLLSQYDDDFEIILNCKYYSDKCGLANVENEITGISEVFNHQELIIEGKLEEE